MSVLTRHGLADRLPDLLRVAEEEAARAVDTLRLPGLGGPARYATMRAWCRAYEEEIALDLERLQKQGNWMDYGVTADGAAHFQAHGLTGRSANGLPDAIVDWIAKVRAATRPRA